MRAVRQHDVPDVPRSGLRVRAMLGIPNSVHHGSGVLSPTLGRAAEASRARFYGAVDSAADAAGFGLGVEIGGLPGMHTPTRLAARLACGRRLSAGRAAGRFGWPRTAARRELGEIIASIA